MAPKVISAETTLLSRDKTNTNYHFENTLITTVISKEKLFSDPQIIVNVTIINLVFIPLWM